MSEEIKLIDERMSQIHKEFEELRIKRNEFFKEIEKKIEEAQ